MEFTSRRPQNGRVTTEPPAEDLASLLRRGALLFDGGRYFEAHEVWEALWKREEGDRRLLLHGLIQVAAAFVKWTRGEPRGAARLLERGTEKLREVTDPKTSRLAGGLLVSIQPWRAVFGERPAVGESVSSPPPFPKLNL